MEWKSWWSRHKMSESDNFGLSPDLPFTSWDSQTPREPQLLLCKLGKMRFTDLLPPGLFWLLSDIVFRGITGITGYSDYSILEASITLTQWCSTGLGWGTISSLSRHLESSEDSFSCHYWIGGAIGTSWTEDRDKDKHSTTHRMEPLTKIYLTESVNGTDIWSQSESFLQNITINIKQQFQSINTDMFLLLYNLTHYKIITNKHIMKPFFCPICSSIFKKIL